MISVNVKSLSIKKCKTIGLINSKNWLFQF
nr:MAG TPA: hypothetical protein [Caudoviricetes sp.]